MKVLLITPEFPLSFWSLRESVAFLGRKTLLPPLGLLTVAALLPQEWEFRLADLNTRALTPADWQWADLVMITGMIIQRQGVLRLIGEARNRHKTFPSVCWLASFSVLVSFFSAPGSMTESALQKI